MPGLPKLPFLLLGGAARHRLHRAVAEGGRAGRRGGRRAGEAPTPSRAVLDTARVEPLELELAPDLLDLLDPAQGGGLMDRVKALRKQIAGELGLVVPAGAHQRRAAACRRRPT